MTAVLRNSRIDSDAIVRLPTSARTASGPKWFNRFLGDVHAEELTLLFDANAIAADKTAQVPSM